MIKKNTLFVLAFLLTILANSQTLVNQEFINNYSGTALATELKDSLLFISGTKSGNKQFVSTTNSRGVIIFDADSPDKIITIINADAATNIGDYISDGNGGFYLAGYFGIFKGQNISANAVIHLKKDLSIIKSIALFNGTISKITLFNNRVIVTGTFTTLNATTCPNIASLDTVNLQLSTGFVPSFTAISHTRAIQYKNQLLLLGSYTVSSINYKMIGVDPMTGAVVKTYSNISFTPSIGCVWNDILFVCSDVKITNPAAHGYLYSYNLLNMSLSTIRNIKSSSQIYAINLVDHRLFLSINKTANKDTININGIPNLSQGLATINLNQATLEAPRFNSDDLNFKIIGYRNQFFRCGSMNAFQSFPMNNFFASDTINNIIVNPLFPVFKTQPNNICVSNNRGMVDYLQGIDYEPKAGMGLLNMKTLKFLKFNPKIMVSGAGIQAIKAVDSTVFIAGAIFNAEGITINNFVAYNYLTHQIDTTHSLKFNSTVTTMEILNDSILLIGGMFSTVNNVTCSSYVAYNYRAKKVAVNYKVTITGIISRITKIDSTIFFSGNFTMINSISKKGLISANVNGTSFLFNYDNFFTNNVNINQVKKCDQKYYFLAPSATDTNIIVFNDKGIKQVNHCLSQLGLSSCAPLKNYMFYGGAYTTFGGNILYKYFVPVRADNNRCLADNSFMNNLYSVIQMVTWGDSLIFYITANGMHRIRFNTNPYIQSPIFTADLSCKQSGTITYQASGAFIAGNAFHLEASTSSTFTSPILLGSITTVSKNGTIPANMSLLAHSTSYYYRIRSTNPVIIGTGVASSIYKRSLGSVSLQSGPTNCMAYSYATYTFTTLFVNSGFNPITENSSYSLLSYNPYKITVKWKDGPIGKIKVVMLDNNGCNTDTLIVIVNLTQSPYGGINNTIRKDVNVFPNVFDNELQIQNINNHPLNILITDANGKLVLEKAITNSCTLPTSSLASGFYMMMIRNEEETVILKLVKR